eukprot:395202-Hanusia_phi.AAC.3
MAPAVHGGDGSNSSHSERVSELFPKASWKSSASVSCLSVQRPSRSCLRMFSSIRSDIVDLCPGGGGGGGAWAVVTPSG